MFRGAWFSCVQASLFVNAFCESGICPFNPTVVERKLGPSLLYSSVQQPKRNTATSTKLEEFQSMMKPETIKVYEERYEEGYDVEGDELYEMWSKMKQLTISESPTSLEKEKVSPLPVPQQKISPSLDEVLTYPNPPLKTQKSKAAMPKHLSSEQVITYLEEKKEAKQREEEEKEKRKQEQEKKRLEREEEKKRKLLERERKKEQKNKPSKISNLELENRHMTFVSKVKNKVRIKGVVKDKDKEVLKYEVEEEGKDEDEDVVKN